MTRAVAEKALGLLFEHNVGYRTAKVYEGKGSGGYLSSEKKRENRVRSSTLSDNNTTIQ